MKIYVDPWAASYDSSFLFNSDEADPDTAELVEDGDRLVCRDPDPAARPDRPLAFIDGVRRGDAVLYQEDPATGDVFRGLGGSHACGAVLVEPRTRPRYGQVRVRRLIIWGSGRTGELPPLSGGWRWDSLSVPGSKPEAPLVGLQTQMRAAEQDLAREYFEDGYLTVLDGPLSRLRSLDGVHVVGYVKTHRTMHLSVDAHRRVPSLGAGQRTSLFRIGDERLSCYLRLAERGPTMPPWAGIVRLEMPASAGLGTAAAQADVLAVALLRFAGVAHRDPRAPQNLQPVGALEKHLRALLGPSGLATRAIRESVAYLAARQGAA